MTLTDSVIDLDLLRGDMGSTGSLLDIIMNEQVFRTCLLNDTGGVKLSRNMLQFEQQLMEHLLEEPTEPPIFVMPLFTIVKKDSTLRPVHDCRMLNHSMLRPPKAEIPAIRTVRDLILRSPFVASCDATGYFYQFPIHKSIRKYFGVKLCGWRGGYRCGQMRRLPMGWSYAPAIGQLVANFVIRDLGVAYIDNFFILADSYEDLLAKKLEFKRRVTRYRIVCDNGLDSTQEKFVALGLQFDKSKNGGAYRLDPKIEDACKQLLKTIEQDTFTVRTYLEILGTLVWGLRNNMEPSHSVLSNRLAAERINQLSQRSPCRLPC